uniref:CR-type domain-containing protein n=1 Tax=Rhodosorus marinus TaxID=101924 RepID=A0A7S0BIN5_9RHOD
MGFLLSGESGILRKEHTKCRACCDFSRRDVLKLGGAFAIAGWLPLPARAAKEWKPEELCRNCSGRGLQECSFCLGTGLFELGDSIAMSTQVCPNCSGRGSIVCPSCVGLGLRNVKGVLRDGSNDGSLRVKKDGSIEILNCEAFPSCSSRA